MLRVLIPGTLFILCAAAVPALFAADPSPVDLDQALRQSQNAIDHVEQLRQSETFNKQLRLDQDDLSTAAKDAGDQTDSVLKPDFPVIDPARLSKAQQDIRALLSHPQLASTDQIERPHGDPPPLIFISFSMPEDDLRGLLHEAAKTGSPVVLRGMVENSMKRTIERLEALLGKDKASNTGPSPALAIDPTLFERFKIDKVPAFVLPIDAVDSCTPTGCSTPDHLKLAGDVSLIYALSVMAREGKASALAKRAADWKRKLEATP